MAETWDTATLALRLLSIDPALGGIVVRARSGPVRDAFVAALSLLGQRIVKLHPAMADDVLHDGLDLTATLASGAAVMKKGLLQRKRPLLLTMAERTPPGFAARLAMHLDRGGGPLIAFDEGASDDESAPHPLTDRLAFAIRLDHVRMADLSAISPATAPDQPARHSDADVATLVQVAQRLGIDSLRAPQLALRAAKAHAGLAGRSTITDDDIAAACALVLVPRATQFPDDKEPPEQDTQEPPPADSPSSSESFELPQDILLDAIRAMLPDDLLDSLGNRKHRTAKGEGAGARRIGNRRGRPLPSRQGRKSDAARIDLIATLRAAAPWQTIRRRATSRTGLQIRGSDIHTKRFEERSDRLLIFAVDASGSAALARLAEVKGAVELLLAQAYARRDHVALISFRGIVADVLLPPTRSLVQTKRRLAALPGGGGTPLAAGLQAAMEQALLARRRGLTPTVCLLTDGRANIARDGTANRTQAAADAQTVARQITRQGIDVMVIDAGNRPAEALRTLAATLRAPYLPLPRANAQTLSAAVSTVLDT